MLLYQKHTKHLKISPGHSWIILLSKWLIVSTRQDLWRELYLAAWIDLDNFWRNCYQESRQSKDNLFSYLI